jgi:hypothetical protein
MRNDKKGGGVIIYIRNDVNSCEISNSSLNSDISESVCCQTKINLELILIGCIYRPPISNHLVNSDINTLIISAKKLIDSKVYSNLLITGDFNYSDINWNSSGGFYKGSGRFSSTEFLDTINSCYLTQTVYEPTFINNTIDLIITNDPDKIFAVEIGAPLGISLNNKLHSTLTYDFQLQKQTNLFCSTNKKIIYTKGDYFKLNEFFNSVNWTELFESNDIDSML